MGCAIRGILERHKPYIAIILAQATFASLTLLSKATITKGMNPYVFVVYRQAFATLALTPFAIFFEKRGILERHKPYIAIILAQATFASLTLLSKATITKGMNPYVFVVYRQAFATLALTPFAIFFEKRGILERHKPYIAIILAQATFASLTLLSKATITKGMNPYVFVVYRQAFATLALTPFAIFFEKSNNAAPLSCNIILKIFFASLFGIMASLNLFCVAMHYTTATLATAASTMVPTITFVMAVLLRLERISIKKWHGIAKVLGSLVSLSGAIVYIFVQGPPINLNWWSSSEGKEIPSPFVQHGSKREWIKGSVLMLSSNTTWALWLITQAALVKQYPSKLRLVTLQCFFSCLQSAVLAMATQRNLSSWKLGSGFDLFTVAYCGAVVTAFGFWLGVLAIEQKGPVFAGMFTPLALIITVIFSAIVWKETHHLGSVCGAILLIGGLYSVLWGKSKDIQEKKLSNEQKSETKEETTLECITYR